MTQLPLFDEPCFFCGEPFVLDVFEYWPHERAFMLETCCLGAHEYYSQEMQEWTPAEWQDFFLAKAGWLKPRFFQDRWRHALLACTVIAAVITPTPDIYNMALMVMPLLGLYFVSYLVVLGVAAGRKTPEPDPRT